jgi:hypothetical protein
MIAQYIGKLPSREDDLIREIPYQASAAMRFVYPRPWSSRFLPQAARCQSMTVATHTDAKRSKRIR